MKSIKIYKKLFKSCFDKIVAIFTRGYLFLHYTYKMFFSYKKVNS